MATPVPDMRGHILDTGLGIIAGRGFTAVGLAEILAAARVPKGSFYHWFASKEAYGEAMLDRYFEGYLQRIETLLAAPGRTGRERLLDYWRRWLETQSPCACDQPCLVVKLAAEVSDLSEAMRLSLLRGTARVQARLGRALAEGVADGSLPAGLEPEGAALELYALWLGASLLAKVSRSDEPLERAFRATEARLPEP
jgi:TetR/AcrR family transcriptional regulator, transcriptional repressor for nem operon